MPAVVIWLFIARSALAAPADDFKAANALYDAGQYAEAAAAYERIEPKTAHIYFNVGNAWFRQEQLGFAILNYERARRLAPRDPDILANLRFAEQRSGVADANAVARPVQRFIRNAVFSRTMDEWARYELISLWLLLLAVAGCIWLPKLRMGLAIVVAAALCWLAAATTALAWRVYSERTAPAAVVLAAKGEARFAPMADATVHFQVTEGTRVSIREDRGQWLFIERADGQQGWVKAEAIARVTVR